MKIECLIFDCDGLMFNTEYLCRQTWLKVAEKYNLNIPDDFFRQTTGAGSSVFVRLEKEYPKLIQLLPEVKNNLKPCIEKAILTNGNINKQGLVELLSYLKNRKDIKTAVASSSNADHVCWLLSTIGIEFHFDAIVCGNMVTHSKPDPEIFLKAAELTNTPVQHCLVLEDSKNGHLAALRAGMHRVFIKDLIEPDQEFSQLIEFERHDLSEVIDLIKANGGL